MTVTVTVTVTVAGESEKCAVCHGDRPDPWRCRRLVVVCALRKTSTGLLRPQECLKPLLLGLALGQRPMDQRVSTSHRAGKRASTEMGGVALTQIAVVMLGQHGAEQVLHGAWQRVA